MPPSPEATLRDLVAAASPDGAEALDRARSRLDEAGLDVRVHDEAGALVAHRGDPTLHLAGHVDVVPADPDAWPTSPGEATLRDGALWGRGAADMLGAVACFLDLARDHPDLPLGVVLTTDEETGMAGAAQLVEDGWLDDAEAIVLGEPTDLALGVAHKGVLWFDVHLHGESAHASMPAEGENALHTLAEALEALQAMDLGVDHPLLGPATLVPTQVRGGAARNQVPAHARVGCDARFPPPLTVEDVQARIVEALEGVPHDLEVDFAIDPYEGDPGGPLARAAADALEAQGRDGTPVGLPFGTEAGRYRRANPPDGPQQIVLGPGDPGLAHTARERVPLDDLETAAALYRDIAQAMEDGTP